MEVTNRHRLLALQQCGTHAVCGMGGTAVLSAGIAEVQRFKHQMAAVATKFPLQSTQFSPQRDHNRFPQCFSLSSGAELMLSVLKATSGHQQWEAEAHTHCCYF